MSGDSELDTKSAAVAVLGEGLPFQLIEGPNLQRYLDAITTETDLPIETAAMELETPEL